jgi:hypothetical protein
VPGARARRFATATHVQRQLKTRRAERCAVELVDQGSPETLAKVDMRFCRGTCAAW